MALDQTHSQTESPDYFARNQRWLLPLIAIGIVVVVPMAYDSVQAAAPAAQEGPAAAAWMDALSNIAMVVGAFAAGLGARLTDTLSARVVSILFPGLAVALMTTLVVTSTPLWVTAMLITFLVMFLARPRRPVNA